MIGGQAGERRLVERTERSRGFESPAARVRRARAVDEAKGVDAVIGAVGETVGERRGGDMILIGTGFGMIGKIGLHRGGAGLAGRGVGARRALERDESLGGRDGEDGGMDHRQTPYLAIGSGQLQRHGAKDVAPVGREGLAAAGREAADRRMAARTQQRRPRQGARAAARIEISGEANALRVGAAIAFMRSEEHTSELQSLMRISYAVFCLKKKKKQRTQTR